MRPRGSQRISAGFQCQLFHSHFKPMQSCKMSHMLPHWLGFGVMCIIVAWLNVTFHWSRLLKGHIKLTVSMTNQILFKKKKWNFLIQTTRIRIHHSDPFAFKVSAQLPASSDSFIGCSSSSNSHEVPTNAAFASAIGSLLQWPDFQRELSVHDLISQSLTHSRCIKIETNATMLTGPDSYGRILLLRDGWVKEAAEGGRMERQGEQTHTALTQLHVNRTYFHFPVFKAR